ncbi:MAG TPA: DUF3592 domain-containing protein [Patescibacteria group bacterium]|nr:DUF3592 domain-containing protein [Patescibacteria group bacterium]
MANWSMARLAGLILLGVGIIFGGFATWMILDAKKYSDNGIAAIGIVVENIISTAQKGGRTYTPLVRFKTKNNETIEFENWVSSNPPAFKVGEKVDVLYIGNDPHDAIIADGLWLLPGIFGGVTVLLLGIASICFMYDFRAPEKKQPIKTVFKSEKEEEFDDEWKFNTIVEVREFLRNNQKIEAIAHYKDKLGVKLSEARNAVDEIEREMKTEAAQHKF